MASTKPFTRSMIERFLTTRKLNYLSDSEGDFLILFTGYPEVPEVRVSLTAEGPSLAIFAIRAHIDLPRRSIKDADWLVLCNTWNEHRRWPKAYFVMGNAENPVARLMLEGQIELSAGTHQGFVDGFGESIITGSSEFVELLNDNILSSSDSSSTALGEIVTERSITRGRAATGLVAPTP